MNKDNITISPLGISLTNSTSSDNELIWCGVVNIIENSTYFLVIRDSDPNWDDQPKSYMSEGEQIYIAIIGCFYILVFFWSLMAIYWNWVSLNFTLFA